MNTEGRVAAGTTDRVRKRAPSPAGATRRQSDRDSSIALSSEEIVLVGASRGYVKGSIS